MKKLSLIVILFLIVLPTNPTSAIDPGTVQGSLHVNKESIPLTHAYAQHHDNAEGLLDRPKEMRIVLADREIPQDSLSGIAFLPVTRMAREGKVRGLLFQFDPADKTRALVTLLRKPSQPNMTLTTISLTETNGVFGKIAVSKLRVAGEAQRKDPMKEGSDEIPAISYDVRFSAPLFHELPVTEDMKGKKALESPQVKVLRAKIAALEKADFEALGRLTPRRVKQRNDEMLTAMGTDVAQFAKEAAADLRSSLQKVTRVVVRTDRAVILFSENSWMSFVREDGGWKSAD